MSDRVEARKPALKNRAAPEIEEVMAALTVEEASFGEMRVDSIRRALSAGCWFIACLSGYYPHPQHVGCCHPE